jgi:drug/metabolite transporter (DMT)-like permease
MNHTGWPTARVALGAATISFAAVVMKLVVMPPTLVALWRAVFACLALVALALLAGRHRTGASSWRGPLWSALSGAAFAGDLFVWHRSILTVGAGTATLLANTQVLWVTALGALVLGERPGARLWLSAVMAVAGVSLLSGAWGGAALPWDGVAYGLGTGVFYAAYYLCLRQSQREAGALPREANLALSAGTCGLFLLLLGFLEGVPPVVPHGANLAWLLVLGMIIHVGGWLAIQGGMAALPAARGSIILLLQPTLACLWGVLFFDEPLWGMRLVGVALTLLAIAAATLPSPGMGKGAPKLP